MFYFLIIDAKHKSNVDFMVKYVIQFLKKDTCPQNDFDQTFILNYSPFHHFVKEVCDIWYLGRANIQAVRY